MSKFFYRIAYHSFLYTLIGIFFGLPSLWFAWILHSLLWLEIASCFSALAIFGLLLIIATVNYDFAKLRE